jgi:ubiquitin carboxyl-terminal hydrolase 25/28
MRDLAVVLEHLGLASESIMLVQLLDSEQERGRFSLNDINAAAMTLGFGPEGPLGVEYGADVPDEFVENAWKECVKRSWRDYVGGSKLQADATKALKIIADLRGSRTLQRVWENGKRGIMSPERAYDTLEVPATVDEEMLITVFTMRASCCFVSEQFTNLFFFVA